MPAPKQHPSRKESERLAKLARLRRGPDDFSDYLELGFSSAEHLQGLVESIERRLRGEEEPIPMEEVFAELEMEGSIR